MPDQEITLIRLSKQLNMLTQKLDNASATIEKLEAAQIASNATIESLNAIIESLNATIESLEKEISKKDKLLEKYNVKCVRKDSLNSSTPPSKEIGSKPKKTQSLRKKGQKQQGGQKKHTGSNMKRMEATRTNRTYPEECQG